MTADATIDYESLQQEALRGLVRAVLTRVAKSGLPGDHHLYISFDVRAPGVILSKRLREKYPAEMTIVLQHRFWDLAINDERFEVKLTFDGIPERLVVPFNAIKVFLDPSVRYVLHFEEPAAVDGDTETPPLEGDETGARPTPKRPRTVRNKPRAEREAGANGTLSAVQPSAPPATFSKPTGVPAQSRPKMAPPQLAPAPTTPPPAALDKPADAASDKPAGSGAQVVSLDAFRKK